MEMRKHPRATAMGATVYCCVATAFAAATTALLLLLCSLCVGVCFLYAYMHINVVCDVVSKQITLVTYAFTG